MAGSNAPDNECPPDVNIASWDPPNQYPNLEARQTQNFAWSGHPNLGGPPNTPSPHPNDLGSLRQSAAEFQAFSARQRSLDREFSEDADPLEDASDGLEDFSDDDDDYREFKASLAKAKDDIQNFRASRNPEDQDESLGLGFKLPDGGPSGRGRNRARGPRPRGGFRGERGPRKAAEPTGDIKLRLGKASEAFIAGNYQEARAIVTEVIRINAETHEAWTILATIFQELGETDKSLTALTYAATLRPKHVAGWLNCARVFLEQTEKHRSKYLSSAFFCYASAIRADPKSVEGRLGKAKIYIERNNPAGAISEYKTVLKIRPHDLDVVRSLCAAYFDQGEVENAKELYKQTFAYFKTGPSNSEDVLTWSDVDSYIAIYEYLGQLDAAIKELKSLSRWLMGRDTEEFWDNISDDDREWDSDSSRRIEVPGFSIDRFPLSTYGDGLPLELRTKLGLCRLGLGHHDEAISHLNWLDPLDVSGEARVWQYSDLYRQVADKLLDVGLHQNALNFYQPLKQIPQEADGELYVQMGKCFLGDLLKQQAEECFQTAIQVDENNVEARIQLAQMYEDLNEQQQAFIFVNEVMSIRRNNVTAPTSSPKAPRKRSRIGGPAPLKSQESTEAKAPDVEGIIPVKGPKSYKRSRLADPEERLKEETAKAEQLQSQYYTLRREREGMKNGDPESTRAWIAAARDLTDDFRSFKTFYPWDKYMRFLGYSADARLQAETPLDSDLSAMADRLSRQLGADIADKTNAPKVDIPADYRGISFSSWLDIFLGYALCLAQNGEMQESYNICEAAKDCVVFYHSREDMFLIHVCWCICALFSCDEETCVSVARFFMKDYQFTTDSYRMFTAVSRMVHSPVSWYSSGPSQKYILRQIKAMDFALVDEERRAKYFTERGSYSAQDENGRLIINDDLDVALLMLYGHILYTGTSYAYALNYFLRAYALDPENPMINLNIGLAYIHYALKRQAENRQHLILQGLTFLFNYYDSRKTSSNIEERQEAHYNVARAYHMLGLTTLALPFYRLVFKEIEDGASSREDLVTDAAYNLQTIYAASGNPELASAVTRKWLVI